MPNIANNQPLNDQNDDLLFNDQQPQHTPYHNIAVPNYFSRCLFLSGWIMTFVSTCTILTFVLTLTSMSGEVSDVFHDSQTTLDDLQIIIPEIKDSLQILEDFCNMPEFHKYCHPN